MNLKLVLELSLFGLIISFVTLFRTPSNLEPVLWIIIFIICAIIIAFKCSGRYFLNGLGTGILDSVWMTLIHLLFFKTYISNHPFEREMINNSFFHDFPMVWMLFAGLGIGILAGLLLSIFALLFTIQKSFNPNRR